jgi:ABC-type sulfate transport system permease component
MHGAVKAALCVAAVGAAGGAGFGAVAAWRDAKRRTPGFLLLSAVVGVGVAFMAPPAVVWTAFHADYSPSWWIRPVSSST